MAIDIERANACGPAAPAAGNSRHGEEIRCADERACRIGALLTLLLVALPWSLEVWPSTTSAEGPRQTDERALLGWAVHLSRYADDDRLPEIRYEPHRFFVEHACRGRADCRVLGWYDDRDVVYVDETLRGMDSLFERSLLVHELVHVLQHRSGDFEEHDCARFVAREREAYAVQQAYFVAHGAIPTVRARHYACGADAIDAVAANGSVAHDPSDETPRSTLARQAYVAERPRPHVPASDSRCSAEVAPCPNGGSLSPESQPRRVE